MIVRAIDFQGMHGLNRSLIDQLRSYLDVKEAILADTILSSLTFSPGFLHMPVLPSSGHLRLSQACELFGNKVKEITEEQAADLNWQTVVSQINHAVWSYVEILESNVVELFSHIDQIGLERWNIDFFSTIESLKALLYHRIDDLIWTIRHLNKSLLTLKASCTKRKNLWLLFGRFSQWLSSPLDRNLQTNLKKSNELLNLKFNQFQEKYTHFREIDLKTEANMRKFQAFIGWKAIDADTQDKFIKIYRLARIWEENTRSKIFPVKEILRVVKAVAPPGKALLVFREYLGVIKEILFNTGRLKNKLPEKEKLRQMKGELSTLGSVISRYRQLLISTDPNPYLSHRLGFGISHEPRKTKDLLNLIFEVENTSQLYEKLEASLTNEKPDLAKGYRLHREIENILHDMGQPLLSRKMLKGKVDHLLSLLENYDELGGTYGDITDFVCAALIKALRIDWNYQVLNENSKFYSLYTIHKGIVGPIEDRAHLNRLHKFKHMIHHLTHWVRHRDSLKHTQDIEIDIHDVKEYFQEFLAAIQKVEQSTHDPQKALELANHFSQQLLEYRFIFSNFLFDLRQNGSEGKWMRDQFIFVNQYFETIENKIKRLRSRQPLSF